MWNEVFAWGTLLPKVCLGLGAGHARERCSNTAQTKIRLMEHAVKRVKSTVNNTGTTFNKINSQLLNYILV